MRKPLALFSLGQGSRLSTFAGEHRVGVLRPAADIAKTSAGVRSYARLCTMIGLVTAPVVAFDQLTKHYIASHFSLYRTLPIIPNWIDLTYTLNPGAAFSLFATLPAALRRLLFLVLSFAAIVI